ncbi:complement C1s subcomponent-like isoform X2 [Mobula hypostoma]
MRVSFTSDFSNSRRYTGFSASYTAVDIDECAESSSCSHFCNNYIGGYFCSCRPRYHLLEDGARCGVNCSGQVFTRFKGEFASPNYPLPYAENSHCHYRIQIEPGFEVILRFEGDFHVEGDPLIGCRTDVLKIKSGRKEYGPFCGDQAPSLPDQLENTVDITFQTDGTGEQGGWQIKYHSTAKQCPLDVVEQGIISPQRDEYDYRDTVQLHCERGYEILDLVRGSHPASALLLCQRDGTWNASSVACVPVDCGEPRRLRHGTAAFSATLFRNRVKYSCEEPYYALEGAEEFECSDSAEWVAVESGEATMPKCTPVCGACHVLSGTGRIFGGSLARPGQIPWQVRLRLPSMAGGGALLSDGWVLTAAHVVETALRPLIIAGVTNLRTAGREERQELEAEKVFLHPGYRKQVLGYPNYDNDVALVKLKRRAKLGPTVAPLCLPGPGEIEAPSVGTLGLIAGWGRTENNSRRSYDLLSARIPVVDMDLCRRGDYAGQAPVFTENMVCAGLPGTDSCQGDSGGAYVFLGSGGRCVARGIVSFGPLQCGSYGVYTQLGKYADWMRDVMAENGQWEDDE